MFQAHGIDLIKMDAKGTCNLGPLLVVFLSLGRWMQNKGQIMKEVDGQGYCIETSGMWENNNTTVRGMVREKNA
jgi:hypothetical protein